MPKPSQPIHPSAYSAELKKRIQRLAAGSRHTHQIFSDWLKIAAICCHQEPYHQKRHPIDDEFHRLEAQYMATIKGYSREELNTFAELFGLTRLALYHEKSDFLGRTYMELELGNAHTGQFFTPFEISLMMAKMTVLGIDNHIKDKGFFSIQEPACGAGGMLIAVAQILEEQGHGTQVMLFDATDVAENAANMCYVQCSMLGLFGVVHYGNSLSQQFWDHRYTPICRVYPRWTNYMLATMREPTKQIEVQPQAIIAAPAAITAAPALAQPMLFDFDLQPPTTPNNQRQPSNRRQLNQAPKATQQTLF